MVSRASLRSVLRPGETASFGRGRANPLRIGHAPEDLHVPRHAGTLECRADGVLVHNASRTRTLTVRTYPGPGFEILPLMVAGTRPHPRVEVVVHGGVGEYAITVDTRPLGEAPPAIPGGVVPDGAGTVGFERIETLSRRHRILLSALCLPVMTRSGAAADVPTYAALEQILRDHGHPYRVKTIKNGLDDLRSLLTYEHGVAGLTGGGSSGSPTGYLRALARWAIHSGNVTDDDLDALEADERDGPG